MRIDAITIGERHRKDMGDIDALAQSIADVGLLHPIVVTPDGRLIAGARRLEACKRLGLLDVPTTIIDLTQIVRGEQQENAVRKDFTPTEQVSIMRALEPIERQAAKERQTTMNNAETAPVNFTGATGSALDKVAAAVGVSRPTLVKAAEVIKAAEQEPDAFSDLVETMDKTGKVDRAYTELKRRRALAQNEALVASTPSAQVMAGEAYQAIVIDPPWDWGDEGDVDQYGRARPIYATMPIDQIAALPVATFAAPNAHLYLWITNRSLPKGFALLDGWGFRYVTMLTWVKPSFGMGNYFRGSTEHVLFGVRGSLPLLRHDVPTHFTAPRPGLHSAKPDAFYELVQTSSPGPWLDMFARTERPGWATWGAEMCH